MSNENKCSGCYQKIEQTRNRLAKRKDWEIKAKEAEQKEITYWENAYNNPKGVPCSYNCNCNFQDPIIGLGGTEYNCDKCKQTDWLGHNEYGDYPPHVCKQKKCSQCNNNFVEPRCPKCEENSDKQQDEANKKWLEAGINSQQVLLKQMKAMKGQPSYSEHTVQQIEQQLAEMISKYKNKYGELPSSLREDDVGGGGWKTPFKLEQLCSMDSSSGSVSDYCDIDYLFSVRQEQQR